MQIKLKRLLAWVVIITMLNPAMTGTLARADDTDIYLIGGGAGAAQSNVLLILDTSDYMNIPEPWREYPGAYDSHVEYLWNDPTFIYAIGCPSATSCGNGVCRLPPAPPGGNPGCTNGGAASNVAIPPDGSAMLTQGYFAGATSVDRANMKDALIGYAFQVEDPDGLGPVPRDGTFRAYARNYGGGNISNYTTDQRDASWIYWLPSGTAETDPRLRSLTFNRWRGDVSIIGSTRGGTVYLGANNLTNYNLCESSKSQLLPSTVYAPTAYPRNSGKWFNQQWMRWDPHNGLDNSLVSSYPSTVGVDTTPSPLCPPPNPVTIFHNEYLGGIRDSSPVPIISLPAPNPPFACGSGSPGVLGQPIRLRIAQGNPGVFTPGDSYSAWTDLKADLGGFIYARIVFLMDTTNLIDLLNRYGVANATPATAKSLAWKGNRDQIVPYDRMIGTPGYYDVPLTLNVSGSPYDTYALMRGYDYLVHNCKADEALGEPYMVSRPRFFGFLHNSRSDPHDITASYTTNRPDAASPTMRIDMYSVNYLNWKFGAKYNGNPVGRKTRLQMAKDALTEVVQNTNDVRFGLMVFNGKPSDPIRARFGAQGGNITFGIRPMGTNDIRDPTFATASNQTNLQNRANLINKINSTIANSTTPMTTSLLEAQHYFAGGNPQFGSNSAIGSIYGATAVPSVAPLTNVADPVDCSIIRNGNCPGVNGAVGIYKSPLADNPDTTNPATCQKSHVVMVIGTLPNGDMEGVGYTDRQTYAPDVVSTNTNTDTFNTNTASGQFEDVNGRPFGPADTIAPVYSQLDEFAYYISKSDIGFHGRSPGINTITTHTIGFGQNINTPLLVNTARVAGGLNYSALTESDLKTALYNVLNTARRGCGAAANMIPMSAYKGSVNGRDVYFSFFGPQPSTAWPGTVKKYQIGEGQAQCGVDIQGRPINFCIVGQNITSGDYNIAKETLDAQGHPTVTIDPNTQSFWNAVIDGARPDSGGTGQSLLSLTPANRKVFTHLRASPADLTVPANAFATGNVAITNALLAVPAGERNNLINWARGEDLANPGHFRSWAHADVLHSSATVLTYHPNPDSNPATADADQRLFYMSTDGMLHSVDAATGIEKWSFLIEEALPFLKDLKANAAGPHRILGEGTIALYTKTNASGVVTTAHIFFGLGRGGRAYYALDVTNKDRPSFMWKIDNNTFGFSELGQTWSTPVVTKIRATPNPALVFSAGYDVNQDNNPVVANDRMGRGLYVVDAITGRQIKAFTGIANMIYSIPATPNVINSDLDTANYADRIYVGDLGGRVWRLDIDDANPANWRTTFLANLSDINNIRKIFSTPAMVKQEFLEERFDAVYVGTGDKEHFCTRSNDKIFAIKDKGISLSPFNDSIYTYPNDFVDITNVLTPTDVSTVSASLLAKHGWYRNLADGEKVTSSPSVYSNVLRFATYLPTLAPAGGCSAPGLSRLYETNALYGGLIDSNNDGRITNADSLTNTNFYSRAPVPDPGFVVINSKIYLAYTGDGKIALKPIGTLGSAKRIYWYVDPEK